MDDINSVLGLMVSHDNAGQAALRYTKLALQYAYEIKLTREVYIRPAMEFAHVWRFIDNNALVFGDELIRGFSTLELIDQNVRYIDVSSGMFVYGENFWIGVSVHHMNQPNESLIGEQATVPTKFSLHGGLKSRWPMMFLGAMQKAI